MARAIPYVKPKSRAKRESELAQKRLGTRYERRIREHHRQRQQARPSAQSRNGPVAVGIQGLPELPRFGTLQQRLYVLDRDGYACRYCGTSLTMDSANLDHVTPHKHGGPTLVANLVASCRDCNRNKGNQTWTPKARKTVSP